MALSVELRLAFLPQRLLGRDVFWWLDRIGYTRISAASRLGRRLASRDALIGVSGKRLRRAGAIIRPRLVAADTDGVVFSDGIRFVPSVVVWSTGYGRDYSWIDIPGALNARSLPIRRRAYRPFRDLAT